MPSKKIAEEIARVRASDPKLRTLTVEFHPVDFLGFSEALAVNKSLESLAIEFNFFEAKRDVGRGLCERDPALIGGEGSAGRGKQNRGAGGART